MSAAENRRTLRCKRQLVGNLQSPQLNALMEQALANNIDLKQAAISVNKALNQANILGADLGPSFSGSLGANASKPENRQPRQYLQQPAWLKLRIGFVAQTQRHCRCAGMGIPSHTEDMANTRLTLINNVADAYFNIAYLNEAIELAQNR